MDKKIFLLATGIILLIAFTPSASFTSPRTAKAATGLKVLILHAEPEADWVQDVKNKLSTFPDFSTIDNLSMISSTPSLSTLEQYNCILVFTDDQPNDPVAAGNVISDYVDNGGGVVIMVFSDTTGWGISGSFNSTGKNLLFYNDDYVYPSVPGTLGTYNSSHPILAGVTSFSGGSSSYHMLESTTVNGGIIEARWSDNDVLAAVSPSGKVVELNFFPVSSTMRDDFWDASTDGALLMRNALVFVSGPITTSTSTSVGGVLTSTGTPVLMAPYVLLVGAAGAVIILRKRRTL